MKVASTQSKDILRDAYRTTFREYAAKLDNLQPPDEFRKPGQQPD